MIKKPRLYLVPSISETPNESSVGHCVDCAYAEHEGRLCDTCGPESLHWTPKRSEEERAIIADAKNAR